MTPGQSGTDSVGSIGPNGAAARGHLVVCDTVQNTLSPAAVRPIRWGCIEGGSTGAGKR